LSRSDANRIHNPVQERQTVSERKQGDRHRQKEMEESGSDKREQKKRNRATRRNKLQQERKACKLEV